MAVDSPTRFLSLALRRTTRSVAAPEDAKNGVASVLAIATSDLNDVDLGKLSREEFFQHFGLND